MWTADITDKRELNGQIEITVLYTDGVRSFTEAHRAVPLDGWPMNVISSRLTQLEAADKATIDLGRVTPPPPEVVDPGRHAWRVAVTHLNFLQKLAVDGHIPRNDPRLLAAAATVVAGIDSYLD